VPKKTTNIVLKEKQNIKKGIDVIKPKLLNTEISKNNTTLIKSTGLKKKLKKKVRYKAGIFLFLNYLQAYRKRRFNFFKRHNKRRRFSKNEKEFLRQVAVVGDKARTRSLKIFNSFNFDLFYDKKRMRRYIPFPLLINFKKIEG